MSFVPYVVEQTSRGERSYDIFSRLLNDRIIMLSEEVNSTTASLIHFPIFPPFTGKAVRAKRRTACGFLFKNQMTYFWMYSGTDSAGALTEIRKLQ